jgi:uncharacterized membrane protein YccF (DUF307 family)
MTDAVLCRRCDTPNPPGSLFCISCAAPMQAEPEAPTLAQPALAAPSRPCPACRTANPATARFCVLCGGALDGSAPPKRRAVAEAPTRPVAMAPALATAGGTTVVQHIYAAPAQADLPLIVRALWFVFVGLPLGLTWVVVAWLFILTLIGMPVGLWMLSMMPQVMTLRQQRPRPPAGVGRSAAGFAVRAVYFVLIGWWASLLWMLLAWLFAATVIGLPLAFMMFERTGAVLTLAES